MSFLEQLCKTRGSLKATETLVTQSDGRRYWETKGIQSELAEKSFGFVVDTKPDNIPAKITENIYLGSQDCCELEVLQNFNIKSVLSIGVQAPCVFPRVTYKFVKCLDFPETNIVPILKNDCLEFIKSAVKSGENVLVHCNAGVSRSSSVVIGFLMLVDGLSFEKAYEIVKARRLCIKPNVGFEKQLKALGTT